MGARVEQKPDGRPQPRRAPRDAERSRAVKYKIEGLQALAQAIITHAVDDYTETQGRYSWRGQYFVLKKVAKKFWKTAEQFLFDAEESSLKLCCDIIGTEPDVVLRGIKFREGVRDDLSKRKSKDKAVRARGHKRKIQKLVPRSRRDKA